MLANIESKSVRSTSTYIQIRRMRIRVPNTYRKRVLLGSVLTIAGIIPLPPGPPATVIGLIILSIDFPKVRRVRRKSTVWIGRRTWARAR